MTPEAMTEEQEIQRTKNVLWLGGVILFTLLTTSHVIVACQFGYVVDRHGFMPLIKWLLSLFATSLCAVVFSIISIINQRKRKARTSLVWISAVLMLANLVLLAISAIPLGFFLLALISTLR